LGDALDHSTQIGPLISSHQRERVISFVENAKSEGARLCCGGKIPDVPELKKGFFFEPTVFDDVRPQMSIFQEEVFGPVASIIKFSNLQEAEELANNSIFGLAGCIWSRDLDKAKRLAAKINAGTVWINTYGMFYPQAPFGGFKQSGFGKELGREGLLGYMRLKHVNLDQSSDKPLLNYWYAF
jgi:acyl-CoA reductase-like NAD-dependent aldehyde dehydrogenase